MDLVRRLWWARWPMAAILGVVVLSMVLSALTSNVERLPVPTPEPSALYAVELQPQTRAALLELRDLAAAFFTIGFMVGLFVGVMTMTPIGEWRGWRRAVVATIRAVNVLAMSVTSGASTAGVVMWFAIRFALGGA